MIFRSLSQDVEEVNGCEIRWMDNGKERTISFTLGSKARIFEWRDQVTNVKDKNRPEDPFYNFRRPFETEYPLVLLGAHECGQSELTIQESRP